MHSRPLMLGITCLISCFLARAAAEDAPAPWTLPQAGIQEVRTAVERAIAAGLPDARGGQLYTGTLQMPEASAGATPARTRGARQSYRGLHLRLADGRWLACLNQVLTVPAGTTIDTKTLTPVTVEALPALISGDKPPSPAEQLAQAADWLRHYAPDQHALLLALMGSGRLQAFTGGSDTTMATAHLVRLGMPGAEDYAAIAAANVQWAEDITALCVGRPTPLRVLPGDDRPHQKELREGFERATDLRMPDPAASFRRLLAMEFYYVLAGMVPAQEFGELAPTAAATGVRSLLADEPGLPAIDHDLTALVGRPAAAAPAAADLATRLATWAGTAGDDGDEPEAGAIGNATEAFEITAQTGPTPPPPPRFGAADLPGLVALAADRSPSRWIDHLRPRSVGDNAIRALALVIGCDPRVLVDRDLHAPWSDAERDATAAALATWWQHNQGSTPATLFRAGLARIPLEQIAQQLGQADQERRTVLLDGLASAWATTPPANPEPSALAQILAVAGTHAGLGAVVATWPVTGDASVLLAAWWLGRGDSKPYDALLAAALASKAAPADADNGMPAPLAELIAIAYHHPDLARLQRLQAALAAPLDTPAGLGLLTALAQAQWAAQGGELAILWGTGRERARFATQAQEEPKEDEKQLKAGAALPLALLGSMLSDQRPVPAALIQEFAQERRQRARATAGKTKAPAPPATDLRIADLAAMRFPPVIWNQRLDLLMSSTTQERQMSLRQLTVDPTAARAVRDPVITSMRQVIAEALPAALTAAGLPAELPGLTNVTPAGDDQAAF